MPKDKDTDGTIPTNMRLLMVLEELARVGVPITPTEANLQLKLPKPTVHRLFHTLEAEGFVQRDIDGKSYSPGRRLRKLSVNVLSSLRVRTVRLSILQDLAEEVGETCNIATPDRDAMVYLDRVETKWPLRIQLPVGTAVPFSCTASGKMYLSSLLPSHLDRYLATTKLVARAPKTITDTGALKKEIEEIRKRGYATDQEEFMENMIAIAVPVHDDQGRLVSTLSIHAPIQRLQIQELLGHIPRLRQSASALSDLLLK